jgi:uroporphyrinogen decarboxylase
MTPRERVRAALDFRPTDRIPRDLGGMGSTGISCFAYPHLVRALGLPQRPPRVHDTSQMLALPDVDVLDALGIDVVAVYDDVCTSAFDEPHRWREFDFHGRLQAKVMDPDGYSLEADGTVVKEGGARMPPGSYVFDDPHGGQPLDLGSEPELAPLEEVRASARERLLTDEQIRSTADYVRRARRATDRAILFKGPTAGLGFPGGFPAWSMVCMTNPEYVRGYHRIVTDVSAENMRRLLPLIGDDIDVIMVSADDQGLQDRTILPPAVFRELYVPYYRTINDAIGEAAPTVKRFLHSCGAIYDIIDDIVDAGFDVLNPVQWSAGGHSYTEWKDRARGRIALWGGGVNTQSTLPFASSEEVAREAREVTSVLAEDSGYVFCAIHNVLAEIPGEKVVAMYRAV